MKKPEAKTQAATGKKPAAKAPVIETQDVEAGSAAMAAATGGTVEPAESALVGKGGKTPAAARKASGEAPLKLTGATDVKPRVAAEPAKPASDATEPVPTKAEPAPVESRVPKQSADKTEPAKAAAPAQNVTVKKTGFWPVALGGVVAAGLGAGATIYALPHLPEGLLPVAEAPVIDTDALRADSVAAAKDEVQAQMQALTATAGDAGAQAGADAAREVVATLPSGDGELQAALEAQAQQIAALEQQLASVSAAPAVPAAPAGDAPASAVAAGGPVTAEALAALSARLQAQAAQIAELQARPVLDPAAVENVQAVASEAEALRGQIAAAAEEAQSQITAVQAEAAKMQEAAAASTKRAEALAAVAALQTALDQGVATDDAVARLKEAGVQPPEAVTADVPTLAALQGGFPDVARAALRAALKDEAASSGGSLIGNFLRAQTGARSVAPRDGNDPDAVLSRVGASVNAGNIGGALDELQALPQVARDVPAMAEWIAGAQSYQAAQAAVTELSGQSN